MFPYLLLSQFSSIFILISSYHTIPPVFPSLHFAFFSTLSLSISIYQSTYFPHPLTSPGQMSGGAIAGVVFGVLAVLALVLVAVFIVRRRWPLWRLESILRGNNSSDGVEFHKAFYSQGGEGGIVDFGQSA